MRIRGDLAGRFFLMPCLAFCVAGICGLASRAAADEAIQSAMQKTLSVELIETPFGRAVEFLADEIGVPVVIDSALSDVQDRPISLQTDRMSGTDALSWVCRTVGTD
ncbi:MAG: hypothetical protein AAGF84_07350 [Planctomycetota bacterium]